jgi:DNA invertase Pin-like site-specific DNA recombinase
MENKTIAYLRVSTVEQDLEKNKADILTFANNKDFGKVKFVKEKVSGIKNWKNRKIKGVIDSLNTGDRLIVPEFFRLGRSMLEIMKMLSILKDKEVNFSSKQNSHTKSHTP